MSNVPKSVKNQFDTQFFKTQIENYSEARRLDSFTGSENKIKYLLDQLTKGTV